ncbi:hypothetical protein [Paraflavitalea speifideaquila]|uniref:hypothetical protein n=1 Tax=Paraflavitalea speifideaquila TaxID=3076558 RepID=UPI0028F0212A|nr:hypothetical protein [Paraflavitalea speifideiaquila]
MTKPLFAILAMTLLIGLSSAQAKILRVGYLGTPVAGVDFATFDNNVITAAANGDTIQIYQNNNLNGSGVTVTKNLHSLVLVICWTRTRAYKLPPWPTIM